MERLKYPHFNNETLYYIDPPYINENNIENKYNKDLFNLSNQYDLINKIKNSFFI